MITEWVIVRLAALWVYIIEEFPVPAIPQWWSDFLLNMDGFLDVMDGVDNWLPVELLGVVLAAVLAAWLAHVWIKIGRTLISHFTGGGGGLGT